MRRGPWHQVDEASLQTDVMRFMAIIAFCLIAILAMVRNVAPLQPKDTKQPPVSQVANTTPTEPEAVEAPLPVVRPVAAQPIQQTTKPIPPQAPVAEKPATQKPFQTPPPVVVVTVPDATVAPIVKPTIEPMNDPTPAIFPREAQAAEEGLTLRFSSESDFLRLVARGKVAVYAFDEVTFLELGLDYRFQQVNPPHQVYELQASTIPQHMSAALPKDSARTQFKWAVRLPDRVERQIQDYVTTVDSGELLINKFEEVHHVPAG